MSVETVHADIRAAFRALLLTANGLPTGQAWEGRTYQPIKGTAYFSEVVTPIYSTVRALGRGGNIQHHFLCNCNLHYPNGNGTVSIETMAGKLLALFAPATSLVYGATKGTILQAERRGIIETPDWQTLPVLITVSAYTTN